MAARPDRQRDKGTKGTNRQVREGTRGGLPRETGPRDGEGGRESRRTQAGAASGGADRDEEGERKEKEGVGAPYLKRLRSCRVAGDRATGCEERIAGCIALRCRGECGGGHGHGDAG